MNDENKVLDSANPTENNPSPQQPNVTEQSTPQPAYSATSVAAPAATVTQGAVAPANTTYPATAANTTAAPAYNIAPTSNPYNSYSTPAQTAASPYSTYGTTGNTTYGSYPQATPATASAQPSYPYTQAGQQYNAPAKKSNAGKVIGLVAICIVLSLISGMIGSMINLGETSVEPTPIEVPFYGNPWADVSESLLESTVWIYAEDTQYAWSGSGVVISTDGYILTNHHVADGAMSLQVIFYDESYYDAEVIVTDAKNDLALIKINLTGLSAVRIGNSDAVRVGDEVIGIGNQFGEFPDTVADGIIAHIPSSVAYSIYTPTCFQTNLAIMPGNSGGGLFNHQGDLIGINSAGYGVIADLSGNLYAPEISYSITIDLAIDLVRSVLGSDFISDNATLDIELFTISDETEAGNRGYNNAGVYIDSVSEYGPAYLAGLKKDDRIVSIGDKIIATESDYNSAMNSHAVGDYINITVERSGQQYIYTIQLSRELAG